MQFIYLSTGNISIFSQKQMRLTRGVLIFRTYLLGQHPRYDVVNFRVENFTATHNSVLTEQETMSPLSVPRKDARLQV